MKEKNKTVFLEIIMLLSCVVIVVIPDLLKSNFWVKSLVKIFFLAIVPFGYYWIKTKTAPKNNLTIPKKMLVTIIPLCLIIFGAIVGGYFLLKDVMDFSNIAGQLDGIGVNKSNFIFVALYIAIVNAFIEEYFFRGTFTPLLSKRFNSTIASLLSGCLFALYHILMTDGWAEAVLIVGMVLGLIFVGMFFDYLRSKYKTITASYFVHMSANLAINFIALFLLGIL